MLREFLLITAISAWFAFEPAAQAQIINVQPLLAKEARPGVSAALEGALDWRTGNTSLLLGSASGVGRYREGRHLLFALARADEGFSAGSRIVYKHLEHLRYRVDVLGHLQAEVFGQFEQDQARRLWPRALVGAGPRFAIVRTDTLDVAVAVAYMVEYQRLRAVGQADDNEQERAHRISSYVIVAWHVADVMKLGETVYVQPRLGDSRDVRLLSESELLVTLQERLALKTAFTLAYDSRPPMSLQRLDTTMKTALQVSF
jgi:hypothetical protein